MSMEIVRLNVNGFEFDAHFSKENRDEIFIPLLTHLIQLKKQKNSRVIAFIAAPPGVGKSTLAAYLETLSKSIETTLSVQTLGLDGFHHRSEYLKNHSMVIDGHQVLLNDVKGCPETFDIDKFTSYLSQLNDDHLMWPIYDRNQHDVIDNQIEVNADILIVEGNWLLLDEEGWRDCVSFADYSIFIEASEFSLQDRLIARKMAGGKSREEAEDFYKRSDRKNILRVLNHRLASDLTLELTDTEIYRKKGENI